MQKRREPSNWRALKDPYGGSTHERCDREILPHRTPDFTKPSILSRRLKFAVSEARQGKLKVLAQFKVGAIVSGPVLRLEIPWEMLDD